MAEDIEGKWLIDSHFIVYSLDALSPYYEQTRKLFIDIYEKKFEGAIAVQNILEAENILINKLNQERSRVLEYLETLIEVFNLSIICPTPLTYLTFHKLLRNTNRKVDIFDYFLAATMVDNDIHGILTLNTKDFSEIKRVKARNPLNSSGVD